MFVPQAWILVIGSYVAIAFAYLLPQDFQSDSRAYVAVALTAFMIRTFLFHLGLLVLLTTVVAASVRRWWLVAAAIPLLAMTVGQAGWSYVPREPPAAIGPTITVMSVNLLHANRETAGILSEVAAARPDVLVLQEYTQHWHRAFQAALADDYQHAAYVCRSDSFGLAVYSKVAFASPADVELPIGGIGTPQARVVLDVAGGRVALYNIHLLPPKRLDWTIEQRQEFADLLALLEREELPVILCGDFNFTNATAFAAELRRRGLRDAHELAGVGRGATWPVLKFFRYLPGIRLDHIYQSSELTSTRSTTGTGRGSDHRPIVAEVGFARSSN